MNKKKKLNLKETGITLVALVVTIIVLLILAGITISLALNNNGVIGRAQYASNMYANATMDEKAALNQMADEVARLSNRGDDGEGGGSGGGDESSASTDYLALEEGETVYFKDANNEDVECIVLYDSKNEHFNTYGVQIITKDTVGTVTLGSNTDLDKSISDFNNAIDILNGAAEDYRATNALNISSDARCVGSVPNNKNARNSSALTSPEFLTSLGLEQGEELPMASSSEDYAFEPEGDSANYVQDWNQLLNLDNFGSKSNRPYFFCSRCIWLDNQWRQCEWRVGVVYANMSRDRDNSERYALHSCDVIWADDTGYSYRHVPYPITTSSGLRPVFTLKSNVKVTETNGKKILSIN